MFAPLSNGPTDFNSPGYLTPGSHLTTIQNTATTTPSLMPIIISLVQIIYPGHNLQETLLFQHHLLHLHPNIFLHQLPHPSLLLLCCLIVHLSYYYLSQHYFLFHTSPSSYPLPLIPTSTNIEYSD